KAVDDPGKTGDFLFGLFNLPDALLLGGDIREAALYVKPQGQPATTDVFLMQGDVEAQLKVSRVRANASVGFAQEGAFGAAITKGSKDNLVSRVHWLGVDLGDDDQFLVRAGRMNLPFGLRSVEHVAWTRMYTRTDSNDAQQDGAAFAFNVKGWRGEVMGIAGNFQESPDAYRERGYSAYLEWDPLSKFTLGASSLITHANIGLDPNGVPLAGDLVRQAHGLFARFTPVKSLVFMAENDFLYDSQPALLQNGAINSPGLVDELETDFEPIQGVHLVAIGEVLYKKSDLLIPGNTLPWLRAWGVVNWFFAPHADVRIDAIYESDAQGGEHLGITTLLGQIHAYL
ncbi:MAG: porin, partial [Polyangiaceae bacterium]